jgi:hypothetical protein
MSGAERYSKACFVHERFSADVVEATPAVGS